MHHAAVPNPGQHRRSADALIADSRRLIRTVMARNVAAGQARARRSEARLDRSLTLLLAAGYCLDPLNSPAAAMGVS